MVTRPSEKEVLRPSTGSGKSRNSHKGDKTFTRADKLLLIVLLLTSVNKGIVAIFTVFTNRAQPFRCLDDFIPHEEILLVHPEIKQDLSIRLRLDQRSRHSSRPKDHLPQLQLDILH